MGFPVLDSTELLRSGCRTTARLRRLVHLKVLAGLACLLAIVVGAVPASAQCEQARQFGALAGGKAAADVHLDVSAFRNDGNEFGQFWEADNPSNGSGVGAAGSCDSAAPLPVGWWQVVDDGVRGIRGFVGQPGCTIPVCPPVGASLTFLVEDHTADGSSAGFVAYTVDESPAGDRWYDLARTHPNAEGGTTEIDLMVEYPAVVVTDMPAPAPDPTVTADYADVAIGFHGIEDSTLLPASATIDSYDVMFFHGAGEPGRLRSSWSLLHAIPYSDAAIISDTFDVPCPDPFGSSYLAIGITFDGVPSRLVGPATTVPCRRCEFPGPLTADVRVTNAIGVSSSPSIVWAELEYGLAWDDDRDGNAEIYFARLDLLGNTIGPELRVTTAAGSSLRPSLVWTGAEYGVAWVDTRNGQEEIFFTRMDALGQKIGGDVLLGVGTTPSLVWTGSNYALSWIAVQPSTSFGIMFAALDAAGSLIGSIVLVTEDPDPQANPTLAWSGSGFAVAWEDFGSDVDGTIAYGMLDGTGNLVGSSRLLPQFPGPSRNPSVAWSGTDYGLVWEDLRPGWLAKEIVFVRIDAAGNPGADNVLTSAPGDSVTPRVAWTGSEFAVTWADARDGNFEPYFTQLDPQGTKMGGDVRIVYDSGESTTPTLVWTDEGYGLAWQDDRDGDPEIYFSPIGCDCADLDLDGIVVCQGDCGDSNAAVYPGAPQLCDGVNNDCSDPLWPAVPVDELDADEDGFFGCTGDCDDANQTVFPGAPQLCDGVNNDCDDPNWPVVADVEIDGDGDLLAECAGDCDDTNGAVYPQAPQLCDGVNNDCDDPAWPELTGTNEFDDDGDTFTECTADCDDGNASVYPGAPPVCDGLNNDCNDPEWPSIDDTNETDDDGDGFSECEGDCRDLNAGTYPGAPAVCDGVNNDCDDPGWPSTAGTEDADDDGDTFSECEGDCDDADATTFPGAPPLCDGLNNDCDDPGWPATNGTEETDDDGDLFSECSGDCDDADATTFPGAPPLCDGINNDCDDPGWPSTAGAEDADDDGDSFTECDGDCDDADPTVFPGAPQLCDGINNDCDDPLWPGNVPTEEIDDDGDSLAECEGDCDDADATVFPGAPQLCDGINNDCDDPLWPGNVDPQETDDDGDSFSECEGDCDDGEAGVNPDAIEICNGIDDNCDSLEDEDVWGEDIDQDGIHGLCDNCPVFFNSSQADTDGDAVGDACDVCPADFDPNQEDLDGDSVGDLCDNCVFDSNGGQTDLDGDLEGDRCDLNDGFIDFVFASRTLADWQDEAGFDSWNQYRGDLGILLLTGVYTQVPGSNPLAAQLCGLTISNADDPTEPDPGTPAHYLVTGVAGGTESSLGTDSLGLERPNDNPCP